MTGLGNYDSLPLWQLPSASASQLTGLVRGDNCGLTQRLHGLFATGAEVVLRTA